MSDTLDVGAFVPGDGSVPVVLLGAFPMGMDFWRPMTEVRLRQHAEHELQTPFYAFEYPGFGLSPPSNAEPALEAIAAAAVETLHTVIGADRAVWLGCSLGGYTAMAIAEANPEVVHGLGLIDTRSEADSEQIRQTRLTIASEFDDIPVHPSARVEAERLTGVPKDRRAVVVDVVTDLIENEDPSAMAWLQRAMAARPDRTAVLRSLDAPIVVIRGEVDAIVPPHVAEEMAEAARTTVTTIPRSGHLPPIEDPEATLAALEPLLEPLG